MRSLAEMVSVRPFSGALLDFPATFIEPALGFAVGVTYWYITRYLSAAASKSKHDLLTVVNLRLSNCISMACLTSAAVKVATTFNTNGTSLSKGGEAAITVALIVVTVFSNVCGVKVCISLRNQRFRKGAHFFQIYGNLERIFKIFKISLLLLLVIFMIAVNLGGKSNIIVL